MYLLFSCDVWRSKASMRLQGVYSDVYTLQEDIVDIFRGELEGHYEENDCEEFEIEDLINQRIDNIHIIETEINERV